MKTLLIILLCVLYSNLKAGTWVYNRDLSSEKFWQTHDIYIATITNENAENFYCEINTGKSSTKNSDAVRKELTLNKTNDLRFITMYDTTPIKVGDKLVVYVGSEDVQPFRPLLEPVRSENGNVLWVVSEIKRLRMLDKSYLDWANSVLTEDDDDVLLYIISTLCSETPGSLSSELRMRLIELRDSNCRPAKLRVLCEKLLLNPKKMTRVIDSDSEYQWLKSAISNFYIDCDGDKTADLQQLLVELENFHNYRHQTVVFLKQVALDKNKPMTLRKAVVGSFQDDALFNISKPDDDSIELFKILEKLLLVPAYKYNAAYTMAFISNAVGNANEKAKFSSIARTDLSKAIATENDYIIKIRLQGFLESLPF